MDTSNMRPVYVIKKCLNPRIGKPRSWGLFVEVPGRFLMDKLGTYQSKASAVTAARLLAGRTADIVIE